MVSLEPLEVRVIDFNRVLLDTTTTCGHVRGTEGYFPTRDKWRDGSRKWDIWAVAAMILEADMKQDEYKYTSDEDEAIKKARQHISRKTTCKYMKKMMELTILSKNKDSLPTLEEIRELLKLVKFKAYDHDREVE
jgi:hypothetical protein